MQKSIWQGLIGASFFFACACGGNGAHAQNNESSSSPAIVRSLQDCTIKVFQNGSEVVAIPKGKLPSGPLQQFILEPSEFDIEVAPAECSPSIVIPPNTVVSMRIAQKPLIYSFRAAYIFASKDGDEDKLLWFAPSNPAPEFYEPPRENSFAGKQFKKICAELNFCPTVYPTYSAAAPFKSVMKEKAVAHIKRLDDTKSLSYANGKSVYGVIYTLAQALPAEYPMAPPQELLFRATFFKFQFFPGDSN